MILSLGDLASRATTFAGGRLDYSLSEASFYVNLAYSEVASRINAHRPKEGLAVSSTSSGQNRIAFPADFDYAIALTCFVPSGSTATSTGTTVVPLRQRDPRWIDAQNVTGDNTDMNTAAGIPEVYMTYSSWIELWPSPNSAYSMQLRYMTKNPVLVQSTDTVLLDDRWHVAVLYKTVELLEAARNNVEGEALAHNRYLNYVSSTPNDFALRQKDRTGLSLSVKLRDRYE